MYKKLVLFILVIVFCFGLCGCDRPKTIILFNNYPITKENLLTNASQFTAGKRFYYIFITEQKLDTNLIRVRVLKKDGKGKFGPVKLVYSNDFRLSKAQIYYYTDYLVLNETGDFTMYVYARYALDKPLITADFRVKD